METSENEVISECEVVYSFAAQIREVIDLGAVESCAIVESSQCTGGLYEGGSHCKVAEIYAGPRVSEDELLTLFDKR